MRPSEPNHQGGASAGALTRHAHLVRVHETAAPPFPERMATMRTIDITGLKSLGRQGLGPWPLDDDHLLRTCRLGHRLTTQEDAQAVFDIYEEAPGYPPSHRRPSKW